MPVEQTPRIRFDRSLANGAIGLGGIVCHLTQTEAVTQNRSDYPQNLWIDRRKTPLYRVPLRVDLG